MPRRMTRDELARGLVVASRAARFAIHQTVVANPHIDDGLAENAEFFALTRSFYLLALCASEFGMAGTGAHTLM